MLTPSSPMLYRNLFIACVALFLASCDPQKPAPTPSKPESSRDTTSQKPSAPVDTFYQRVSQLIGGMDSTVAYADDRWDVDFIRQYCRDVSEKMVRMERDRLNKISIWNASNIQRNQVSDSSFCFYPFSGGDFIHANWLYPNASEYLLVAKEQVGTVPNIMDFSKHEVNQYLKDIDVVLRDIYNKSYFITKNMRNDIKHATVVNGMFPIILWASARTHHDILSVKFFTISSEGSAVYIDDPASVEKVDGVEILTRNQFSRRERKVTYLSVDISDKGFEKRPEVQTYLRSRVPAQSNTFVKSASYLMHYGSFGQIRQIVLDKSKVLVQDDTGIPWEQFDKSAWNLELYGVYEKPVSDFSENLYQADLAEAYKMSEYYKGPLDFSLGYHWGTGNQNQMFAIRK
jgi:hypothetical protein